MNMPSFLLFSIIVSFILRQAIGAESNNTFDQNFYPYWGLNHFRLVENGDEAQLLIDPSSGSGFKSRLEYESGLFHIKMRIPEQKTGGIIPNFYLISNFDSSRDELDFEFMGTRGLLQTNIYTAGLGGREQRFQLPFDPSDGFHSYHILWNQHQIVWFVDDTPIRVLKNNPAEGVKYPTKAMHMEGTVWNGSWAGEVDWSLGPFVVRYRDIGNITACSTTQDSGNGECHSPCYFWNDNAHSQLSPQQQQTLENARKSWMIYDYCRTNTSTNYPECSISH